MTFAPAQVAQLEAIVRALSGRDRLRPLLEQVLDTLVLWTGVERGLLLLRAPDGRLVPRAARNLARHDFTGDQLALSQTIAHRAMDEGDAVVATAGVVHPGDGQTELQNSSAVAYQGSFKIVDFLKSLFRLFTGDEIMHPCDEDIFVMGAVKDPDVAFGGNMLMDAPQKVVRPLLR